MNNVVPASEPGPIAANVNREAARSLPAYSNERPRRMDPGSHSLRSFGRDDTNCVIDTKPAMHAPLPLSSRMPV